MITAEQIPNEVVDKFYMDGLWMGTPDEARAAIAAALNAWPNAKTLRDDGRRQTYIVPALILPLPQEAPCSSS
jgi:hypothetical protein